MTLFYILIQADLICRIVQFCLLYKYYFFDTWVFIMGDISLIFDIFIGIVHCQNLSQLILMIRQLRLGKGSELKCKNSTVKWSLRVLISIWVLIGLAEISAIIIGVSGQDQFVVLMILFILLSICVISLTLWLTQEIKTFGGKSAELFS